MGNAGRGMLAEEQDHAITHLQAEMLQGVGELIRRALNIAKGVGLERPVGPLMDERDLRRIGGMPIADIGCDIVTRGKPPLEGVVDLLVTLRARSAFCFRFISWKCKSNALT